MYKFWDSLKTELKIFNRIKWMYVPFALFLIYFLWKANDFIEIGFAGDSVNMTPYITQALLFLFSVYGVLLIRQEKKDDSYEVFSSLSRSIGIKAFAKLTHLVILSVCFVFLSALSLFLLFYIHKVPSPFYLNSIIYLILYWIIPSCFGSLVGLIAGLWMRTQIALPFILLIGLITGPLNQTVLISTSQYLPQKLQDIAFFVNMGQSDPMFYYNIVYGLPTESFRFISRVCLLVILLLLLAIVVYRKQREKGFILLTVLSLVGMAGCSLYAWQVFSPYLNELTVHQSVSSDNLDYQGKKITYPEMDNDFDILNYKMQLSLSDHLTNKVTFRIKANQSIETPIFTLYHGFNVQHIRYKEQELPFKQEGDYLKIDLPEKLARGELGEFELSYSGKGPQRFFSNTHAVMLPGFFAWYPIPGTGPSAVFEDYYMTLFRYYKPNKPIQFELTYDGPTPLYTNLKKEAQNTWSGSTTLGLTLVSGAMEEIRLNDTRLVRPYALYKMEDPVIVKQRLNELYTNIGHDLGIKTETLKDFFVLDTELIEGGFWVGEDHFIVSAGILSNHIHAFETQQTLIAQMAESLFRKGAWYEKDHEMRRMIVQSYAYAYTRQYIPEDQHPETPAPLISEEERSKKQKIVEQINEFIDLHSENKSSLNHFFEKWAVNMQKEEPFSWDDLEKMISNLDTEKN